MEQDNPCCSELKKRYVKLEEKRNALRQAVKLLENQTDKVHKENLQLKQGLEQGHQQLKLEKDEKEKEARIRLELEKEISDLKTQLQLFEKEGHARNHDGSSTQEFETRVLESETEIKRLKILLEKEKKKFEAEKKKVESEKNNMAEVHRQLEVERRKVLEEKRLTVVERNNAEEYKVFLEKYKMEANESKQTLAAERAKAGDAGKNAESERQKAIKEKKCAASERAMAKEAKRLLEVEKKKAKDEKERANHLKEQLECERKIKERLEKEMKQRMPTSSSQRDTTSLKENICTTTASIKDENIKLLKEKLKFEKKQVKHAKQQAKLLEAEKGFMWRELHFLKQEFHHFSGRLSSLDDYFCQSIKGIDEPKIWEPSKPTLRHFASKAHNTVPPSCTHRGKKEVMGSQETAAESLDLINIERECIGISLPKTRANHCVPTSGINSDLESPVGDSIGRKSQSSMACSTSASFSDSQFMGSQEKGSLASATTNNFAEKHSKCRNGLDICHHLVKSKGDLCTDVSAKKRGICHVLGQDISRFNATTSFEENGTAESAHMKKRRIEEAMQCVVSLYSEEKKLHLKFEEQFGKLGDLITEKISLPSLNCDNSSKISKQPNNVLHLISEDCDHSRHKIFCCTEKLQLGGQKDNQGSEIGILENMPFPALQFLKGDHIKSIQDKPAHFCSFENGEVSMPFLEDLTYENLMKLLESDSLADEERYRAAIARPLSPTLPILEPPKSLPHVDSPPVPELVIESGSQTNLLHVSNGADGLDTVIEINTGESKASDTCQGHKKTDLSSQTCDIAMGEQYIEHGVSVLQSGASEACRQIDDSKSMNAGDRQDTVAVTAKCFTGSVLGGIALPSVEKCTLHSTSAVKENLPSHHGEGSDCELFLRTSLVCVTFVTNKNENSIARIFKAINSVNIEAFTTLPSDQIFQMIMSISSIHTGLQPHEKASVLLSLLLEYFSNQASTTVDSSNGEKAFLECFGAEIERGMSNPEICTLLDARKMDCIFKLIEDFLTRKEILTCSAQHKGPSQAYLGIGNLRYSTQKASIRQLVAGSKILASFCSVLNHAIFLWEVSYKILCTFRNDIFFVLKVLHTFASVCGVRLFAGVQDNLFVVTIKSIVLFLEMSSEASDGEPFSRQSASFKVSLCCKDCLFHQDAVSLDEVVPFLMRKLDVYLPEVSCVPSVHSDSEVLDKFEQYGHNYEHCPCEKIDTSFPKANSKVNTLCGFVNVLSLLELIASYMGWCWSCEKIIPGILRMLQLCASEEYLSALFVFTGKLGRLGVDSNGHENEGVAELRSRLSIFFNLDNGKNYGFLTRAAAACAMIDLLPLSFREIIRGSHDVDEKLCSHGAKAILSWFSLLNSERQECLMNLFEHADLQKK